ncbi:MAG: hypothetical protein GYB66_03760 [Chloroflexi bacterium]|nr:hypothetical protein [Chloroflexota bacterium]
MRGRVLILIGLIILGAVLVAAVFLLGTGGDDEPDEVAETEVDVVPTSAERDIIQEQPTPTEGETQFVPVSIALQDLPRGTLITREDIASFAQDPAAALVDIRFFPLEYAPETAVENPEDLIGCRTRTTVPRESAIVVAEVVPDPSLANALNADVVGGACRAANPALGQTGSDAALFVPSDRLAISVPLNPTGYGQVAYGLKQGDRVDVLMSFLFIDVDEEFQTRMPNTITVITRNPDGTFEFTQGRVGREEPSEIFEGVIVGPSEIQQRPRLVTQRTIQDAVVIHVGWFPEDGVIYGATPTPFEEDEEALVVDPTVAAEVGPVAVLETLDALFGTEYIPVIMTIAVRPQDALVLTWAIDSNIPISYALRPAIPADELNDITEPVTLEYLLREFEIEAPPKLPLALEPAITDIRRFDLFNLSEFIDYSRTGAIIVESN